MYISSTVIQIRLRGWSFHADCVVNIIVMARDVAWATEVENMVTAVENDKATCIDILSIKISGIVCAPEMLQGVIVQSSDNCGYLIFDLGKIVNIDTQSANELQILSFANIQRLDKFLRSGSR